jgi:hypothetical protein
MRTFNGDLPEYIESSILPQMSLASKKKSMGETSATLMSQARSSTKSIKPKSQNRRRIIKLD